MNRYKIVFLLMVVLLLTACVMEERTREDCKRDCTALDYEYSELLHVSGLYRCQCWNEDMDTRHNPWGKQ